jgi:integrase
MVKALTDAELKIIRVHDLRHSYITHMIQSQAMINAVSKYVGHKDITTTLKIYTHNTKDSDENLLNIINSQL